MENGQADLAGEIGETQGVAEALAEQSPDVFSGSSWLAPTHGARAGAPQNR
jgi:hypothetical protein